MQRNYNIFVLQKNEYTLKFNRRISLVLIHTFKSYSNCFLIIKCQNKIWTEKKRFFVFNKSFCPCLAYHIQFLKFLGFYQFPSIRITSTNTDSKSMSHFKHLKYFILSFEVLLQHVFITFGLNK